MEKYNNVVFFDGYCNLCSNSVLFIIKNENLDELRFTSINSIFSKKFLKKNNINELEVNSILYLSNGKLYDKSDAALEISARLNLPYKLFYLFKIIPKFLRDKIYLVVANNRYRIFGKKTKCFMSSYSKKYKFIF
ncbi:MAG: hypothetical protein CMD07_04780 [Flavobacteriales bacterium]|nr:hypothetical protein [Flavobacteriales bacterium]|tara:strand:+ start:1967 stop:2371 length:405 start_codon:yes stop_codon:yes gene_type:complete